LINAPTIAESIENLVQKFDLKQEKRGEMEKAI
jgi:hypothetical protein